MAHAHIVSDSDNHFVIDPISRQLSSNSKKTILMKTDHNSEQFTFELPRTVEGHDMSTCNKVEVHYININSKTRQQSAGIYNVVDFGIDAEDDTKVLGTWLVSREATKYAGSLNFVLRFACVSADEVEEYSWNTAIYAGITIADGICNTETVVEDYVDILRQWLDTIEMAGSSGKVYVITDDGTIQDLSEMVNNFSEQVTELDEKLENLQTDNTEFKDSVNGVITEFKESVNSEVAEFKESVTEQQTAATQQIANIESTVNGFNERIENIEDFTKLFKDSELSTGTLGETVIGTEGTFYIKLFQGSTNPVMAVLMTKGESNTTHEAFNLVTMTKGVIMAFRVLLDAAGKVHFSLGSITTSGSGLVYTESMNITGTFLYRKLS